MQPVGIGVLDSAVGEVMRPQRQLVISVLASVVAKTGGITEVTLGLKWKDFRETISEMERLVELMGLLIRNAGFAWDSLEKNLEAAASGFWEVPQP